MMAMASYAAGYGETDSLMYSILVCVCAIIYICCCYRVVCLGGCDGEEPEQECCALGVVEFPGLANPYCDHPADCG